MTHRAIVWIAITWALFQLWYASPLPYWLGVGLLNSTQARSIHLGFAITLVFLSYPLFSPLWMRWGLALVGAGCATYPFWFYEALAMRAGAPTELDVVITVVGFPAYKAAAIQVQVDDGLNPPQAQWLSLTRPPGDNPLHRLGLSVQQQGATWWINEVAWMSQAEKAGLNAANDNQLLAVAIATARPSKEWFAIPALLLLAGLVTWQRKRNSA